MHQHEQNRGFVPSAITASINKDFTNSPRPARILWESYGRPEYGDKDGTLYRKIDGYISYKNGYTHIEAINGDEFIIANGKEFAPSKEEAYGKEVTDQFDTPDEDLPPTHFEDEQWVIGKLDGDTCKGIGINVVVLLPEETLEDNRRTQNVANLVSQSINTLQEFDQEGQEHALESVKKAINMLDRAKKGLNGEYKEMIVTGIPQNKSDDFVENITFTHE